VEVAAVVATVGAGVVECVAGVDGIVSEEEEEEVCSTGRVDGAAVVLKHMSRFI
jgi:predicted deacylase